MKRFPVLVCASASIASLHLFQPAAHAAVVVITSNSALSTEGLGAFVGTLDYVYGGAGSGTLNVSLTNTTNASIGGYLTAFMFRPPPELGAFTSALTSSDFAAMTNIPAGTSGSPWNGTGSWLGGAGVGGSWLAGGAPNGGVAIGQTGHWSFTITGTNASMLTSDSFVSGDLVSDPYAFIVRFRGMEGVDGGEGSDKVPANQLPAPGAAALIGLAGILTRRRTA
jgi:hypothetical protein